MQYCDQYGSRCSSLQDDFPVSAHASCSPGPVLAAETRWGHRRGLTKSRARTGIGLLAAVGFITMAQTQALASDAKDAQAMRPHHRVGSHHPQAPANPEAVQEAGVHQVGYASYYGPRHHGHTTASGERFDQEQMTAAHPWLPFGSRVLVTDRSTGRQVIVTITDRLGTRRRLIDLSLGAARELGMVSRGVAVVELTPL